MEQKEVAPLLLGRNYQVSPQDLKDDKLYVLRCISGEFQGRFLYINITEEGEIFGSADPEQHHQITMYVENADLSPFHASITFVDQNDAPLIFEDHEEFTNWDGRYMLNDLDSQTGTWLSIKNAYIEDQHWMLPNLSESLNKTFSVGSVQFTIEKDAQLIDTITLWLNYLDDNGLSQEARSILNSIDSDSLDDLLKQSSALLSPELMKHTLDIWNRSLLIYPDIKKQQKVNKLVLKTSAGQKIKLDGGHSIFGAEDKADQYILDTYKIKNHTYNKIEGIPKLNQFECFYDFKLSRIILRRLHQAPIYTKLAAKAQAQLYPGDYFKIGALQFEVQRFNVGVAASIGSRPYQEDAYQVIQDLGLDPQIAVSYFAVFDGHGGDSCPIFLKHNLHCQLVSEFVNPSNSNRLPLMQSQNFEQTLKEAVFAAFKTTDLMYQKAFPEVSKQCGSTAVICLIIGSQLVCINLGDARSVLSRNGKAFDMSVDYKASRKDEQERIKSQGGYIVFGRVLGRLAVTRAFGDFECKQIQITDEATQIVHLRDFVLCEPEIRITQLNVENDDFLILASDGLYDRFSSEDVIEVATKHLLKMGNLTEQDPQFVAQRLVKEAVHQRMNSDNTTVLLIALNNGVELQTEPAMINDY